MAKTEVYSWRLDATTKSVLENVAREKGDSIASILDTIVTDWLREQALLPDDGEEERQRKLHHRAEACFGAIHGGNPSRAERASELVRERLHQRRAS